MKGKAAPLLLVMAALTVAATVLLTTRTPTAPTQAGEQGAPVDEERLAGAEVAMPTSTTPPAESGSPQPRSIEQNAASSAAPAPAISRGGPPASARNPGTAKTGEDVEQGRPGSVQAEMAVVQALSAAGLSTTDIQVATLGSAPAAAPTPEAAEAAAEETGAPPAPATRDLNIPVPTGAKVPVVFYDNQARPLPQQQALDRIANEFSETINNPPAGYSQQEVWDAARKLADERYTVLYGFDAFNQMSMQAAKEALKEKKAATVPTTAP